MPTYHSPPQGVRIAAELDLARLVDGILLGQVHEVGREDEAQEANVQGGDELLETDRGGRSVSQRPRAPGGPADVPRTDITWGGGVLPETSSNH